MFQNAFIAKVESVEALAVRFGKRIYPVLLPANSPVPALVYYILPSPKRHAMDGATGYQTVNLQTIIYDTDYKRAWDTADALRDVIDGSAGTWGEGADAIEIGACLCTVEGDLPILRADSSENFYHGVAQTWEIQPQ